jgi:hypothetical protein
MSVPEKFFNKLRKKDEDSEKEVGKDENASSEIKDQQSFFDIIGELAARQNEGTIRNEPRNTDLSVISINDFEEAEITDMASRKIDDPQTVAGCYVLHKSSRA